MAQKSSITIPAALVSELEAWGEMTARLFGEIRRQTGIKPVNIPDGQAWFWSKTWQQGEQAVDAAISKGEYKDFETVEELINELHTHI